MTGVVSLVTESPPRVRGKGQAIPAHSLGEGITPAYAGKRTRSLLVIRFMRDHPRVCGEKDSSSASTVSVMGSPPRMRGKGYIGKAFSVCPGITPAYAGKRLPCCWVPARRQDHPRVCGEKKSGCVPGRGKVGSPPRMRGKALVLCVSSSLPGITPAYAGKSERTNWTTTCRRDHPRVCGEKKSRTIRTKKFTGSPPRMRGKVTFHDLCRSMLGITPAYAGKRTGADRKAPTKEDHPRVCGEKTKKIP